MGRFMNDAGFVLWVLTELDKNLKKKGRKKWNRNRATRTKR